MRFSGLLLCAALVLALAPATLGQDAPANLHGTWEWKIPGGGGAAIALTLDADGTGKLDDEAIRWSARGEKLAVVQEGETTEYAWKLAGDTLTLSGGDLDQPTAFTRRGAGAAPPKKGLGGRITEGGAPKPADPAAPATTAPAIAGTWQMRNERGAFTMSLDADGSGSFNAIPLRWSFERDVLTIVMNGTTVNYSAAVGPATLRLSGGDLDAPATFQRDGAAAALAPAPGPAAGPTNPLATPGNPLAGPPGGGAGGGSAAALVGRWQGKTGSMELRPDGTIIVDGQTARYTADATTLTLTGPSGSIQIRYDLRGDALTLTGPGGSDTLMRVPVPGGAPQDPGAGAAASGPAAQVAGVWVANESSLDPQYYMSYTQYVILFPDGTVGYAKSEGGATRSQVTAHLERFRSWHSGAQGGGDFGRWETDGRNIVVQWNRWNNLLSRGQVDIASGALTLSGMGALNEGATLTFKREQ